MDVVKAAKSLTVIIPEIDCDQTAMGLSVLSAISIVTWFWLNVGVSEEYLKCLFGEKA
jgi:hypothetical protein